MMYAFSLLSAIILLAILPRNNLVLAQAEDVAVEGDLIDLYAFREARNWTEFRVFGDDIGNVTGRPSDCSVVGCDDGAIAEDCIPYIDVWPANVCIRNDPRLSAVAVLYRRTTDPDKIAEGFAMEKCFYSDLECSEANRDGECQGFKVDTCSSDDDSAQEIKKLQDWCMVGTQPRGDYVVPLIATRDPQSWRSDTDLDCATAPYEEGFLPLDPQLCVQVAVREGNQLTLGSSRLICNEDGSLTSERWDDTTCMGSKENLYEPVSTIPGSCPANGVIEAGVSFAYIPSCAAPSIFCKDLAGVLPSVTRQAALSLTLDDTLPASQDPIVSQTPSPVDETLPGDISVPATLKPSTTTTPPKDMNDTNNLVVQPTSTLHSGAQRPKPEALQYVVGNIRPKNMTTYLCLCRRPEKEEEPRQQYQSPSAAEMSSQVVVETVTDEEETEDLLPPTADTLKSARLPPPCGVVYMFPRAWKERTNPRARDTGSNEPESSSYFSSSYCTIS